MEQNESDLWANNTDASAESPAEHDSLNLIVPLTCFFGAIFVVGVLGNLSTCIVILRNKSMHTATNFYLLSLAVSDLILLLFGLPLEISRLWNGDSYTLGEPLCLFGGYISESCANATVLTITAFTVERYFAICRPFQSHTMSNCSRTARYIVAVWGLALCLAIPQVAQFGIVTMDEVTVCTVKGQGMYEMFVISSFVFFITPMGVITVLYILIAVKLYKSQVLHPIKKSSINSYERNGRVRYKNSVSQRKVIQMLVVVALSFFVCWAPFHVQRVLAVYGRNIEEPSAQFCMVYVVLTYVSGVLYFLSPALNPFLYNLMSNKFRNAFKKTFIATCRRRAVSRMGRSFSEYVTARQRVATSPRSKSQPLLQSTAIIEMQTPAPLQGKKNSVRRGCRSRRRGREAGIVSPTHSISNSSLREFEQEYSVEELASYLREATWRDEGLT